MNKRINILFLVAGVLAVIYVFFKDATAGPIFPCYIYILTGLYCPGCGMTRATHSILRLDFYQALRYNILPFIIGPLLVYFWLYKRKTGKTANALILFMIIIAVAYGILRNIPFFSWLTPTVL